MCVEEDVTIQGPLDFPLCWKLLRLICPGILKTGEKFRNVKFFLERICWGFFSQLPGEEPAVNSCPRWGAGRFAHLRQLVGWQGTRHVGCQLLVSITSDRIETFWRQSCFLGNRQDLWRKSAVLEMFGPLQHVTCVTVWTGMLPLLGCTFTERDQSLGRNKGKSIKWLCWSGITPALNLLWANWWGKENVQVWPKFWAVGDNGDVAVKVTLRWKQPSSRSPQPSKYVLSGKTLKTFQITYWGQKLHRQHAGFSRMCHPGGKSYPRMASACS